MITQNKTPYCLGIKNTKNQKIANTTGGWKLTYLQSWDKADLSHWKRFHFRNPLRRPQSWNEQLSLLLRPRPRHHIVPHNTLDISHPVLVHFSQSIPQPILRERYEDWMTNRRGSYRGIPSHYYRIFLMVLRKPEEYLKKVIRNRCFCRPSYWAPTQQVPSVELSSIPICSVYIVYTLHHPIYYTSLL